MADRDPPRRDAPDLIALPPLIWLAALGLAIGLEWLVPLDFLPGPLSPGTSVIGALLVLAGIGSAVSGGRAFRSAETNADPRQPALVLVETGPYRITRNPMYVGFLLAFPGIGLIASLDWTMPLFPALWLVFHHGVVLREEAYLARKFGADYETYRARTRRWLL